MQLPTELSTPCYHDEEAARVQLEVIRWPDGPYCPLCGSFDRVDHEIFIHNVLPLGTEEEIKSVALNTLAPPNTQTSTICLGDYLVVHVMSSDRVWRFMRNWRLPREVAGVMAQIWPVQRPVDWPTALTALNDAGLNLLSMEFFEEMRLRARIERRSS